MKKLKIVYVAALVLAVCAGSRLMADSDPALSDGSFTSSLLGSHVVSSRTATNAAVVETRRLSVANNGRLDNYSNFSRSSTPATASVGYSTNNVCNGIQCDSNTVVPSLLDVGSSSEPLKYRGFILESEVSGVRLRVYDTRGSTLAAIAPVIDVVLFSTSVLTANGNYSNYNLNFSSGLLPLQDKDAKIKHLWSPTKRSYAP